MKKLIVSAILLAVLVTLSGCGVVSIPTEDGGKVNLTKDGFTVEGADGGKGKFSTDGDGGVVYESEDGSRLEIGEDLALPDGYPDDILPLYQKDSIVSTSSSEGNYYVLFSSKASLKDCTEYYKSLVKNIEDATISTSDINTMIFANISGRECAIIINEDSENNKKAFVSLTIG